MIKKRWVHAWIATCCLIGLLAWSNESSAFCGFYVSGATTELYNNATMVVMMREGTRTVLAMRNDYQGPPQDFALVVPVPVVLKKEEVKTLSPEIFAKVDAMASPRLVEYWEQDPCQGTSYGFGLGIAGIGRGGGGLGSGTMNLGAIQQVKVEARFEVGEYEIVILSAKDSGALDTWLRAERYNIPAGAEAALRPYIAKGSYFFVARVNAKKVIFADGRARLSPLRFHYESKEFELPVRLGLLNASKDKPQDLLVHILARGKRYEAANAPNVTIPTNLDVDEGARGRFGAFYAALYDKAVEQQPGAVVTEYAWDASSCDPCPGPTLAGSDFMTLGADVLPGQPTAGLVLTRLHARYTKESLGDDLVFREAGPITGGREVRSERSVLEQGATPATINNFQARYAIRHVWEGEIACDQYIRGRWGARPRSADEQALGVADTPAVQPVRDVAYVDRSAVSLTELLRTSVPELSLAAKVTTRDLIGGRHQGAAPAPEPIPPASVEAPASLTLTPPASAAPASVASATPASAPAPASRAASCAVAPTSTQVGGWLTLALGGLLWGLRRRR